MQDALFDDGSDLPLFTETPIPVNERKPTRPAVLPGQLILLEPACRTCMDCGEIRIGRQVRFCWCQAGQEVRRQKGGDP
jgi:hypothetical protein